MYVSSHERLCNSLIFLVEARACLHCQNQLQGLMQKSQVSKDQCRIPSLNLVRRARILKVCREHAEGFILVRVSTCQKEEEKKC